MNSIIKRLASQTAIYGLSSIAARLLNFLLVPLHTAFLAGADDYGKVGVMFAYAAFMAVLLTYGMETAFFNFSRQENEREKSFSTSGISIVITTTVFLILGLSFNDKIAWAIGYPQFPEFVQYFVLILSFDAVAAIPLARLRLDQRPWRFATARLLSIGVNILFNVYFLVVCPWLLSQGYDGFLTASYNPNHLVHYIFISNAIGSAAMLVFLLPELFKLKAGFHLEHWKKMIRYAAPLIFVGMAGIVNETFDRIMIKQLLPEDIADHQAGIYNAFYKLSIIMTMFVQAFRYAAEPFFFSHAKEKDARSNYAEIMNYFVLICCLVFLGTMFFIRELAPIFIRKASYFNDPNGLKIVPILLMANLFLGIYYNLSVWYKLTDNTKIAAVITIAGALVTLFINYIFIPKYGFLASAWATLIVYFSMTLASTLIGRRYYPVPYSFGKILLMLAGAIVLFLIHNWVKVGDLTLIGNVAVSVLMMGLFVGLFYPMVRATKKL